MERVLAINPGATSTKIAVFDGEKALFKKTIEHHGDDLKNYANIFEQYEYRLNLIKEALAEQDIPVSSLNAAAGRGGLLKSLAGGTYLVNDLMVSDLKKAERGEHASNLGGALASGVAAEAGVPAVIVDPVSVDEYIEEARYTGLIDLPRVCMSHALNSKAVARKVASSMGGNYDDYNLIVVHLGTGISVSAHMKGRMIDVNNSQEEGPLCPDRCGTLPARALAKLCYSGKYTEKEMLKRISGNGGIFSYHNTRDIREVDINDPVIRAMSYQVAKEVGAMAAVLSGEVDKIALTGGIAHSKVIVDRIVSRIKFIAPVEVLPGEEELESLALGALRMLRKEETPLEYK